MGIPLRHLSVRHSDSTPTVGSRSHPGGIENILPPRDEPRSVEGPTSGRESAALGSRRRRRCDEWRDPSRRQRSRPTAASRRERHGCAPSRPSRHRRTTDPALSDVDRWHRSRTGCTRAPGSDCDVATSRARSASGKDQEPAAASARARRRRRRPSLCRDSTQWATSSSRTIRRRTTSMTNALAASSGSRAAASTTARGRHEIRSGPSSTSRSSMREVRRMVTH